MADGTKSLGEKLFDSLVAARAEATTWTALSDDDRTICEKAALDFCARLSHDEATAAVIAELRADRDALREAHRPYAAVSEKAKGKDDACWCGQDGAVIRYRDLRRSAALVQGEG